jgi:hypothetical protein
VSGRRVEHVLELAEGVLAEDVLLVVDRGPGAGRSVPYWLINEKVVTPELGDHFVKLAITGGRPVEDVIAQALAQLGGVVLVFADRVGLAELREAHLEPRKLRRQLIFQRGVLDGLGPELLLDPLLPAALRQDLVHLARPGAEAQAVEDVDDLLAVLQRGALNCLYLRGFGGFRARAALDLQAPEGLEILFTDPAWVHLPRARLGGRSRRQQRRRDEREGGG